MIWTFPRSLWYGMPKDDEPMTAQWDSTCTRGQLRKHTERNNQARKGSQILLPCSFLPHFFLPLTQHLFLPQVKAKLLVANPLSSVYEERDSAKGRTLVGYYWIWSNDDQFKLHRKQERDEICFYWDAAAIILMEEGAEGKRRRRETGGRLRDWNKQEGRRVGLAAEGG